MKHGFVMGIVAAALLVTPPLALAAQAQGAAKPSGATASAAGDLQARSLGTVRLSRSVKANGEVLKAGTYQVRLTAEVARPEAAGTQPSLSRWVEFVQGGQVRGREVASVIPAAEIGQIAKGKPVPNGGHRVEMLKDNEFVRVWINREGTNYLIHMPPA